MAATKALSREIRAGGLSLARFHLRWWLLRMALLPFLAPPSFRRLLRLGSPEMISFYDNLRAAAETFSQAYGEDYHQQLMQVL